MSKDRTVNNTSAWRFSSSQCFSLSASSHFIQPMTTASRRCFSRRLVIESLVARRAVDLHIDWIMNSKAGQLIASRNSCRLS